MRRLIGLFLLLLPLGLTACGVNMAGEPDLIVEAERGDTFDVRGSLVQQEDGGPALPPELVVSLLIVDARDGSQVALRETSTDAAGEFAFEDVPHQFMYFYQFETTYAGIAQGAIFLGEFLWDELDAGLTPGVFVWDPPTDGGVIEIDVPIDETPEGVGSMGIADPTESGFVPPDAPASDPSTADSAVPADDAAAPAPSTADLGLFALNLAPVGESPAADAPTDGPAEVPAPPAATVPDSPDAGTMIQAGPTIDIRGTLVQGTADGPALPPGLEVSLFVANRQTNQFVVLNADAQTESELVSRRTFSDENNTFTFTGVPYDATYRYFFDVIYADVPQGTQAANVAPGEDLEVEITLFERTIDPATVSVTYSQTLINFAPTFIEQEAQRANVQAGIGLEIRQEIWLQNTGDQIVTTDEMATNGWPVAVRMELPVNSFGIEVVSESDSRYEVTMVNNFIPVVKDTWPLMPGDTKEILVLYYLPYTDSAIIETSFGYPALAAEILVPNDVVRFESEQFETEGEFAYRVDDSGLQVAPLLPGEDFDETNPQLVRAYELRETLPADQYLSFTLLGRPSVSLEVMSPERQQSALAAAADDDDDSSSSTNLLSVVLAGMGLAVLGLAGVMWWRQRRVAAPAPAPRPAADGWQPPNPARGKEALLAAIAELDAAYEAGDLARNTYHARRERVKELLFPLMDDAAYPEDEA
ncbi:MAG: hypothetical protein GYB65_18075 [Chloroflexi bacterium]|nr:hypothetical protein [Chloroflexota bacterium]